jgi:hypothetical protein
MAVFTTECKGYLTYSNLIIHLKNKLMEKVYIVFWTFTFDVEDHECQPQTSMVGVYSTEELAQQKVDYLVNSIRKKEILSYDEYTAQCAADGYISSDPELDYHNYFYTMNDNSSNYYYYEEWSVLEKLGE